MQELSLFQCAVAALITATTAFSTATEAPNVVIVVSDDQSPEMKHL